MTEKAVKAMEAGLTVLKFSLDAMDDEKIKTIRKKANYDEAINKIHKLEIKKEKGFKTIFVPCMIALNTNEESKKMHKNFIDFWKGKDVFAYVKSQDNRWLFEQDKKLKQFSLRKAVLRVSLDIFNSHGRGECGSMYTNLE